jgi:hypothetical protein
MADSIEVHCAHCGKLLGTITYVPGSQTIGCTCGKSTEVSIYKDGTVSIYKSR